MKSIERTDGKGCFDCGKRIWFWQKSVNIAWSPTNPEYEIRSHEKCDLKQNKKMVTGKTTTKII